MKATCVEGYLHHEVILCFDRFSQKRHFLLSRSLSFTGHSLTPGEGLAGRGPYIVHSAISIPPGGAALVGGHQVMVNPNNYNSQSVIKFRTIF